MEILHTSYDDGIESLSPDERKPASTQELMKMIKEAGTELTVKYITGEISFEDFCVKVELKAAQSKTEKQSGSGASASSAQEGETEASTAASSRVPGFDQMLKENPDDDDDEEDDEDKESSDEDKETNLNRKIGEKKRGMHVPSDPTLSHDSKSDDVEMEVSSDEWEFDDAGAIEETSDNEWKPNKEDDQKLKQEGTRKRKQRQNVTKPDLYESPRKKPRKKRMQSYETPKFLRGAQGKAMLLKAQGHTQEAMMMLFEIIKKAPKASAPYEALGVIKDEMGLPHEGLKFLMVAANLRRAEPETWFELSERSHSLREPNLAKTCMLRAMKYARTPENKLKVIREKIVLSSSQGKSNQVLFLRESALPYMPRDDTAAIAAEAKKLVKEYMSSSVNDIPSAISTLTFLSKEIPMEINAEDIHLLVELLMLQKSYAVAIGVMIQHCGVKLTLGGELCHVENSADLLKNLSSKNITLDSIEVPALMPYDLHSKMVQCFILMRCLSTLDPIRETIDFLIKENVDEYGDIHLEIAEAMLNGNYPVEAKPILHALVHSEKFSKAEVWLTYAICLKTLGEIKPAAEAYEKVLEFVPKHTEARYALAMLQQSMGQNDTALQTLSTGVDNAASTEHILLLYKSQLLLAQDRMAEFMTSSRKLLTLCMGGRNSTSFILSMLQSRTVKGRQKNLLLYQKNDADQTHEISDMEREKRIQFKEDFWKIFLQLCYCLHDQGRKEDLLSVGVMGATCPVFYDDPDKVKEAEFICIKSGIVNKIVVSLVKSLILENPNSNQAWNMFSIIMTQFKDASDQRFITRALMRDCQSPALGILNGNARLISGSYEQALAEYLSVFRQSPNNTMALLCCGLCLLHVATKVHTSRRNGLIQQGLCFLKAYKDMRGECQEVYYNIARAFCQINYQYAAIKYYKKALMFSQVVDDGKGTFDLTREIAHNLSQLYVTAGNPLMAKHYIRTYLVI